MYEYAELVKTSDGWQIIKNQDDILTLNETGYLVDVLNKITSYGWQLVATIPEQSNITYIIKRHKLSPKRLFRKKGVG